MSGIINGFSQLFKNWGRGIGNAVDNLWLDAEARKAISDEVGKKFQPMIDKARGYESKRAANITDLGKKLAESKKALQDAKDKWQQDYDKALAGAKAQRQTDITDYDAKLQGYQDALNNANANKYSILDQLRTQEATYDPYKTLYTDVNTGDKYILNRFTGNYENLTALYLTLNGKEARALSSAINDFGDRLYDSKSGKVINAFDKSDQKHYKSNSTFNNYLNIVRAPKDTDLRNADNQITKANKDLNAWNNVNSRPKDWDNADLNSFENDFKANNGSLPKEYSFNGQTYSKELDLDQAYKGALAHEQSRRDIASRTASGYASKRDAEIAKRIQDAKDIKKAKLALGGALGTGALYAGAKAIYGGDDTDNTDNTDNTYTGEPDPDFNVEKEGQAILKDRQQIDTDFDPDKAEAAAVLASGAYDKGVEDGSSVRSSGDLGNNIGASTRGHTMDDRLYELIKAMKDPYKADAVANYIYSRHGDDPEVQRLGWRGWLNKYYGDSLRSILNIDPSGYKGMHISGGL